MTPIVGSADAEWTVVAGIGPARRLTSVEEMIVASSRPGAPVTLGLLLHTDGRLDADRLRRAVGEVTRRHPMTRARLHRDPSGRLWWRLPPAAAEYSDVDVEVVGAAGSADADAAEILARICSDGPALAERGPLRVVLARLAGSDAIVLGAHHAAFDGASLVLLLGQLIRDYADADPASSPPPPPPPPPPPTFAATAAGLRADAPAGRPTPMEAIADSGSDSGAAGWRRVSPPARIASGTGACRRRRWHGGAAPGGYGVHAATVPLPSFRPLLGGARVTVNDLLVAAAHAAVERWNDRSGRRTGVVRIRVAVDLRTGLGSAGDGCDAGDAGARLGNRSGEIMVNTDRSERAEPARLVRAVCRQTRRVRLPGRADRPDDSLSWLRTVPAPLRPRVLGAILAGTRWMLMPTASVSNLGRLDEQVPSRLGSARITSVHFAAFAGPPQALFVCATGHGGRLQLAFAFHTSLFDRAGARRFAGVFLEELRRVAAWPVADRIDQGWRGSRG
jgi:NRPS condensation-like uncharacterized protein